MLRERAIAVLLLDLNLEAELGVDLLEELSDSDRSPAVIIVSAFRLAEIVAERYDLPLVAKPFDLDALLAKVVAAATAAGEAVKAG